MGVDGLAVMLGYVVVISQLSHVVAGDVIFFL